MMLGEFRQGRWTHILRFYPKMRQRYRSLCGRARSEEPPSRWEGDATAPGCPYCIRTLRERLAELEARR